MPLMFSALLKGERFRIVTTAGIVPAVYTKVAKGVCKDADGQWLNVHGALTVEPIQGED